MASSGMWAVMAQDGMISTILSILHVDNLPTPSHHIELALDADDTAATAMSRQLVLLVSCLETPQRPRTVAEGMEDSHQYLEENCDALRKGLQAHLQAPISTGLWGANLLSQQPVI